MRTLSHLRTSRTCSLRTCSLLTCSLRSCSLRSCSLPTYSVISIKTGLLLLAITSLLAACAKLPSTYSPQEGGSDNIKIEQPSLVQKDFSNQPQYQALHRKYRYWLVANNVSPDRVNLLVLDASNSIKQVVDIENGAIPEMQLPDWYKPGGTVPAEALAVTQDSDKPLINEAIPMSFEQPSIHSAVYLGMLHFKKSCLSKYSDKQQVRLTLLEYQYLHQFFLNEKIWNQVDFGIAEAAVLKIENDSFSLRQACRNQ